MLEEENKEAVLPLSQIEESELYHFAKKCYELLRDHGHIDIMKEINQLGVIRKGVIKNDGEDPTRNNYVAIQLNLIYRFNISPSSKGLGLANYVKEISDKITAAAFYKYGYCYSMLDTCQVLLQLKEQSYDVVKNTQT